MSDRLPFRIEENGRSASIIAEKQFFTGQCILDVSAELSHLYDVAYDARSDPDAIVIMISPKDETVTLTEAVLRRFMNALIDHQTWLDLNDRFGAIREKIVAEAFSPLKKL